MSTRRVKSLSMALFNVYPLPFSTLKVVKLCLVSRTDLVLIWYSFYIGRSVKRK